MMQFFKKNRFLIPYLGPLFLHSGIMLPCAGLYMLDQQEAPSRTELSKGVHNFNNFHQDGMQILFFVQIKLHFFSLNMRCHLGSFWCQCRSCNFYIWIFYLQINNLWLWNYLDELITYDLNLQWFLVIS